MNRQDDKRAISIEVALLSCKKFEPQSQRDDKG